MPCGRPRRDRRAQFAPTCTRLSASSTQSTGTWWIRRPFRSASSSSSVSKNQPSSRTAGSSLCATSARTALNPHCASRIRVANAARRRRLYDRENSSRFGHARDRGVGGQPRADREVTVAGDERCDEREQRGKVGRQVDVHVREHPRVARAPRGAQRSPASLLVEMPGADRPQVAGETGCAEPRGVGRRVVDDRDLPPERERGREVRVQPGDARLEGGLLVVDGHHDVHHRDVVDRRRRVDARLFDLSHARSVATVLQRRAGAA